VTICQERAQPTSQNDVANCNWGGIMATKAYILIKVKAGKGKSVLTALKGIAGVEQIHACFGQPDIFVFINVADERALSDVVITRIHAIEGVEETDTHIVAET
jgi:DNA-binding Lrp family transcriptional regulator